MRDETKSPEKPEAKPVCQRAAISRDVAPVDARTSMWRVVKLYAWLATLLVAVWGLALLTAWVYKQPPPKPRNPLEDAFGGLYYGMSEDEARAVIKSHDREHWKGLPYGGNLSGVETIVDGDIGYGPQVPDGYGGSHVERVVRQKALRWRWDGDDSLAAAGWWHIELDLYFEDGKLKIATPEHRWEVPMVCDRQISEWITRKK